RSCEVQKEDFTKTEDDLKSLQSVGQIIGEVLRPLDNERLIVKASSGPRYVLDLEHGNETLVHGRRLLWVDPVVYNMLHEDPRNTSYSAVGGLSDQIRELKESRELPLMNPELFLRVPRLLPSSVSSSGRHKIRPPLRQICFFRALSSQTSDLLHVHHLYGLWLIVTCSLVESDARVLSAADFCGSFCCQQSGYGDAGGLFPFQPTGSGA
ncbi:hypothetical protein BVRB_016190, partial [Beta vulgaris subsp. vulgaris]